jgi:hypothetical protein
MDTDQIELGPLWRDNGSTTRTGTDRRHRRRQALVAAGAAVAVAAAATAAYALAGSSGAHSAAGQRTVSQNAGSGHVVAGHVSVHDAPGSAASGGVLPAGQQGTAAQVPWSQVGPGWTLSAWNPDKPSGKRSPLGGEEQDPTPTTLFLVDPAGGRYAMDTLPVPAPGSAQPDALLGWSGDGQRALLDNSMSSDVAVVDLSTGTSQEFSLGAGTRALGFTSPDGLAILANAGSNPSRPRLERFSLTGQLEHVYPSTFTGGHYYNGSDAVESPSGTQLAVSTSGPVELMANDGQVIRSLPVSASAGSCVPLRWWSQADLLATCMSASTGTPRLWLVPASGAAPSPLTSATPARGDLGDLNAWSLPSGTYVQDAGACGYLYVAKLLPSTQTTPVTVPGVPSGYSSIVLGSYGSDLAIQANGACAGQSRVMWFNPGSGTVTPLLGAGANGGYTSGTLLYGEPAYRGI